MSMLSFDVILVSLVFNTVVAFAYDYRFVFIA
jgi:hypothetical protein